MPQWTLLMRALIMGALLYAPDDALATKRAADTSEDVHCATQKIKKCLAFARTIPLVPAVTLMPTAPAPSVLEERKRWVAAQLQRTMNQAQELLQNDNKSASAFTILMSRLQQGRDTAAFIAPENRTQLAQATYLHAMLVQKQKAWTHNEWRSLLKDLKKYAAELSTTDAHADTHLPHRDHEILYVYTALALHNKVPNSYTQLFPAFQQMQCPCMQDAFEALFAEFQPTGPVLITPPPAADGEA